MHKKRQKFGDLKVQTLNENKIKQPEPIMESVRSHKGLITADFPLTAVELNQRLDIEKDAIVIINESGELKFNGKKAIRLNEYYDDSGYGMKGGANGIVAGDGINKQTFAWIKRQNSYFISARPNQEKLDPGMYEIQQSMEAGIYLERKGIVLDDLFLPPDEIMLKIVKDIEKFWASKQKYEDYGIIYKRGILTYGMPGCGKTSLINMLISRLIKDYGGIAINMTNINTFLAIAANIRALEPDMPILAIIEDLDGFLQYNSTQSFLNLLDGTNAIDNVVFLGSTNYVERLEPRIVRSSRFDRKYELKPPCEEVRRFYFEKKLKEEDIANLASTGGIDKWVKDSDGFAFSDLKDMIASIIVMEIPYEETIQELKKQVTSLR